MQVVWIIVAMLGAAAVALPLWLAYRWLAGSWEVLDDDELSYKLSSHTRHSPAEWLRLRGWFARKPHLLTYRRDERGRFRRVRR
jgi:hypothetical protein